MRELVVLRGLASRYLSPAGRPIYRVVGLFDGDTAGQKAVNGARGIDISIIEYRDVFRLHPIMPKIGSVDPAVLRRSFESQNEPFKRLTWELEDLISEPLMELFLDEYPTALIKKDEISGFIHRELTRDGKSRLIRFCKENADLTSLKGVVDVLHALRHYMSLKSFQ